MALSPALSGEEAQAAPNPVTGAGEFDARPQAGLQPGLPQYWYYDHLALPLPERHGFPRGRFTQVRIAMRVQGLLLPEQAHDVAPAEWSVLERIHTPDYLRNVREGTLSPQAIRELGLPFSPALVTRARAVVSATVNAAVHVVRAARTEPSTPTVAPRLWAAGVIGGGTHHAFAERGAGYCLFNDIAVAIHVLRGEGLSRRIAVVDLDVHQGNGTAEIFHNEPEVFTFSVHGEKNWPHRKSRSDFDLGLPDGTGDDAYLDAIQEPLEALFRDFRPEVVFYQAGVDPLATDRLGRLSLTPQGLRERDRRVFALCREQGCPVVLTLGGGYSRPPELSVAAHLNTVRELAAHCGPC